MVINHKVFHTVRGLGFKPAPSSAIPSCLCKAPDLHSCAYEHENSLNIPFCLAWACSCKGTGSYTCKRAMCYKRVPATALDIIFTRKTEKPCCCASGNKYILSLHVQALLCKISTFKIDFTQKWNWKHVDLKP